MPDGGDAATGPVADPHPHPPVREVPKAGLSTFPAPPQPSLVLECLAVGAGLLTWAGMFALIGLALMAISFCWTAGQMAFLGLVSLFSALPVDLS